MRSLSALLVSALLLAGCVSPGGADLQPDENPVDSAWSAVLEAVGDLPCEADVGDGTSANIRPLTTAPLDLKGYAGTAELWLQDGLAVAARHGTGGFSLVNVSDPLNPIEVAAWDPAEPDRGLDVKMLPDGSAVLTAGDAGIRIVDVRDPANPTLEFEEAFEKPQAHMLTVFTVDGETYVAAAKGNGEDLPIWRVAGEPGAHTLEKVSSPALTMLSRTTGMFSPEDLVRPHDAYFHEDPLLGKPLLWIAVPWEGVVALDVSDPANPVEIATILNTQPEYTHTVQTVIHEDRRITVSVGEVGVNTMRVWDTTDLENPVKLAEWSVPVPAKPQHNLQVLPPYVYVAHYDEGTYVFSLDDLLTGTTAPVARIASESASGPVFSGVWDVGVKDGLLYTTDGALRVYAFGCLTPGDVSATSVG